jgi:hypothetical protein
VQHDCDGCVNAKTPCTNPIPKVHTSSAGGGRSVCKRKPVERSPTLVSSTLEGKAKANGSPQFKHPKQVFSEEDALASPHVAAVTVCQPPAKTVRITPSEKGVTDSPFLEDPDADEMSTALWRVGRGHIMAAEAEEEIGKAFMAVGHALERVEL